MFPLLSLLFGQLLSRRPILGRKDDRWLSDLLRTTLKNRFWSSRYRGHLNDRADRDNDTLLPFLLLLRCGDCHGRRPVAVYAAQSKAPGGS